MTPKKLRNFLTAVSLFASVFGSLVEYDGAARRRSRQERGRACFLWHAGIVNIAKISQLFTRKYPFIKVNVIRLGSERLAERVVIEGQAKSAKADVIHESEMDFYGLLKKGLIDSYDSPQRTAFRPQYRMTRILGDNAETLNVIAYNTNLVKGADVPKSFSDLLAPKWKGKILMTKTKASVSLQPSARVVKKKL